MISYERTYVTIHYLVIKWVPPRVGFVGHMYVTLLLLVITPIILGPSIFASSPVSITTGTDTGAGYVPGTPDCTWVRQSSSCHSFAIEASFFILFFFYFRNDF